MLKKCMNKRSKKQRIELFNNSLMRLTKRVKIIERITALMLTLDHLPLINSNNSVMIIK